MGRGAPLRNGRHFCLAKGPCGGGKGTAGTCTAVFSCLGFPRPARIPAADGRAPRMFRGHAQALGQLVPLGSAHRCASTCGLSTRSSTAALRGRLISGRVSRLDAFSAYPFRTRLPGGASGDATGAPLVRPARSSRTKASPPQASHARNR